ncbi:STAS domain-containing protein [Rhodobacter sp. SGA-6-6]|uniref:STAS domain-containing protein n=1 Tax=Rhodobacter sp. SGA-6-6 TaxID=2710882 RepID=UPI0013EC3361|nr:STAS domain-containing protein [Rhodobacter sp. SGA-6-6]NGM47151.1 STAS domain-containing protein [Rhodobacter sp. SGA-6-6]
MTAPPEFTLPERISVTGENALLPFLRAHPDAAVQVSAARLRRLDTPLVQALLAAAADRRARGIPFRLTELAPEQAAHLAALGVTAAMLDTGGAA